MLATPTTTAIAPRTRPAVAIPRRSSARRPRIPSTTPTLTTDAPRLANESAPSTPTIPHTSATTATRLVCPTELTPALLLPAADAPQTVAGRGRAASDEPDDHG